MATGMTVGLFAVTGVHGILVPDLFFARGADHEGSPRRITLGRHLGFAIRSRSRSAPRPPGVAADAGVAGYRRSR
ncbi:hypothetical protein GCM10010236_70040 [Streptomyces eurythermus]|nr:hypothetical protein GCM10010236_70040 [Streptomyces eurythermus]